MVKSRGAQPLDVGTPGLAGSIPGGHLKSNPPNVTGTAGLVVVHRLFIKIAEKKKGKAQVVT